MTAINAILAAIICVTLLALLLGFVFGRITAPQPRGPLVRFKLTDAQLTLIAYEASRAYKIAHGDLSAKSFNNLPRVQRAAMVARLGAYRRSAYDIPRDSPAELQLQAAIVALAV